LKHTFSSFWQNDLEREAFKVSEVSLVIERDTRQSIHFVSLSAKFGYWILRMRTPVERVHFGPEL
jgi:hypothetical protein